MPSTSYYFWYRDLPDVNPARYDSPEAYLEAVRYRPLDTTFSYIASRAANDAFYSDSQYIGFGLSTHDDRPRDAGAAGVRRQPGVRGRPRAGRHIVAIGGRRVAELDRPGAIDAPSAPADEGVRSTIAFTTRAGASRRAADQAAGDDPHRVPDRVFDVGGRKVGYLFFRNFVRPVVAALDAAFAALTGRRHRTRARPALQRRRPGRRGACTWRSLIGGAPTATGVREYRHNDKQPPPRRDAAFRARRPALGLAPGS